MERKMVIIDVGACVGEYTEYCLDNYNVILACGPYNKDNSRLIKQSNQQKNGVNYDFYVPVPS